MALPDSIQTSLANAAKLKANGSENEANTKALLIEPMLAALGWDPVDLDSVEREVRVYEGTFLDYALKIDGRPRIYVEAKAVGENLDDKKFIAQTVNYANNDGVVWCALTNGVRWRVYKTNETAPMDQKRLFEVDLGDESDPETEKLRFLRLVSRDAVRDGELDRFGERVFTDGRVRAALARLAADPPGPFLDQIRSSLGHPRVPDDALARSLARVLDAPEPRGAAPAGTRRVSVAQAGPASPPRSQEYPLDHHLGNKSALIVELFRELNGTAMALGPDVTRRIRKQYIGYFRGRKSFVTAEFQQRRVIVYLSLDLDAAQPWNGDVMRDVSQIGHFGMGDIEYSLTTLEQVDEVAMLVRRAYDRRG
jgi:predicted transport protein